MPNKDDKPEKAISPELKPIQELYELMLAKGLDVVELKDEESLVRLTRRVAGSHAGMVFSHHPAQALPIEKAPVPDAEPPVASSQTIPTPLAGLYYRASSPTSAPFVKEGDTMDPGQTLCIVEAMKVMNEIKAETRIRILKILVENGRPVTAGQALFQIESA